VVTACSLASTSLHDTHASAETHATTTASAATGTTCLCAFKSALRLSRVLLTGWVTDCLVDGEDRASGLTSSRQNVQTHELGLPHKFLVHVVDVAFEDIDSLPATTLIFGHVDLSKSVKNVD